MPIDITSQVPVVDGSIISRNDFQRDYQLPQKPVVLRGLWKKYPAYTKWTMDHFRKTMGSIEVSLFGNRKEDLSKTLQKPNAVMRFDEYLDLIEHHPTDLRMWAFPVFKYRPEMLKDFGYPEIASRWIKLPFMFFGPPNSVVRMHQDIDMSNIYLTQFHGRKKVVLFPPDQSELLYRLPFNVHSIVDIENPDYAEFPGLEHVKGVSTVLEHGDTLFIPSGWWHHIVYLEGGFGLALRAMGDISTLSRGLWNLTALRMTDNLMNRFSEARWFEYKKGVAFKRARNAIERQTSAA